MSEQRPVSRKGRRLLLYGLAIALGVCLAVAGFLVSSYTFLVIPLTAYILALGFNLLTQVSVCTNVNVYQCITLGSFALIGSFVTLFLHTYVGMLSSPIVSLFPNQSDEFIAQVGAAFYLFWAGLYAQITAGGFLQTCAKD